MNFPMSDPGLKILFAGGKSDPISTSSPYRLGYVLQFISATRDVSAGIKLSANSRDDEPLLLIRWSVNTTHELQLDFYWFPHTPQYSVNERLALFIGIPILRNREDG